MSLTAIFYLLVYFGGLLRALFGKPIFGLYAYLFAFYLHPPARWWGGDLPDIRWSLIAALVTFISIFIYSKGEKKIWLGFVENKYFTIFALYVVLQTFWAINPEIHKDYVFLVIKFLMLIFIMQNAIRTERDLIGVIVVNLLGVCYFAYLGLTEHSGGRLEGIGTVGMESANQLGQHMATVLIFSAYLLLCDFGKKKYLLVPLVLFALNGVLLTESRGVIIGMVCGGIAAFFVIPRTVKGQFKIYAVLAALAGTMLLGPQIIERFNEMRGESETGTQDTSAASRMVIIRAQAEMFSQSPLLGHGHRGTLLLSPEFIAEEYLTASGGGGARRASHNFLFALLVDHGLIGAFFYLMVIYSCWKKVWQLTRDEDNDDAVNRLVIILAGLGVALVALMAAGMGSNNKKLEIDIWLYALIPLVHYWVIHARSEDDDGKNPELDPLDAK